MVREFTARIDVAVFPKLRGRLEKEALYQHCTISQLIRLLLDEGITIAEAAHPLVPTEIQEYELFILPERAARLQKLGYVLTRATPDPDISD